MRVFSNTAISLDGKLIAGMSSKKRLGSHYDLIRMRELYNQADAIVLGGSTFRDWPIPLFGQTHNQNKPIWNVVLTRNGDLPFSEAYLTNASIRPLVFVPDLNRHKINSRIDIMSYKNDITPTEVLEQLSVRGIRNVLLMAGGDLLSQFLRARCLHEMFITLCPRLVGGPESGGLVLGSEFLPEVASRLHLQAFHAIQDELYLHYKVLD